MEIPWSTQNLRNLQNLHRIKSEYLGMQVKPGNYVTPSGLEEEKIPY